MEMREELSLWVNVHARELRGEICSSLLAIGHAVDPVEQFHRVGVVAVWRIFRERVVKAVD